MAVNLPEPTAADLLPVAGVRLGSAAAGIRSKGGNDLLVISFEPGSQCAGVFTRNRFCAAPVIVCREHLQAGAGAIRAVVINAGNANAGTGKSGLAHARQSCVALAEQLDCAVETILPLSTGVILEPLPVAKLEAALPAACADLQPDNWLSAARSIMTTDTLPKAVSRRVEINGVGVTITGITKGAGMIRPNMGTMLSVIATDAAVPASVLDQWLHEAVDASFNRITVDGDTSTNDTALLVATGQSGVSIADAAADGADVLRAAIAEVSLILAQAIVRDGEGATKFVTINVEQAANEQEAAAVAYAIAHSPLIKTAFYASDPNLGRLLAAIGYAGIDDLDVDRLTLLLDDVVVASDGGRDPGYQEADGQRILKEPEFAVTVRLDRGAVSTTVWTCDLSHDYVSINADYRS